jgi:MsuE subfamily FMN reductase
MKLLGVSASPSVGGSKTLLALRAAIEHARSAHPDVTTEIVNVRDYDVIFCDGRDPDLYEGDTRAVIDKVVEADALIVATPMYRGSYTGILKNLFDVLPNSALEGKAVGFIATAGSDHHFLAIEHELKPLIGFFYGHAIPGAVYMHNAHFAAGKLVDDGMTERLCQLADAVVEFGQYVPRGIVGAGRPTITRQSLAQT